MGCVSRSDWNLEVWCLRGAAGQEGAEPGMRALCTEVAGVLEAVATADDEDEEGAGAQPATAPSRFAAAVKASREAAAQAGLAVPATCAPPPERLGSCLLREGVVVGMAGAAALAMPATCAPRNSCTATVPRSSLVDRIDTHHCSQRILLGLVYACVTR